MLASNQGGNEGPASEQIERFYVADSRGIVDRRSDRRLTIGQICNLLNALTAAPEASEVELAGAELATIAFNLAQRDYLPERDRRHLDSARTRWDAALTTSKTEGK